MPGEKRIRPANIPSLHLSKEKNDILFTLLGKECITQATGAAELYLADTPGGRAWNKQCCGVVCLVRDYTQRSYFIRVFDLKNRTLVWEQEVYITFKYNCPRDYFFTFEADRCRAALSFSSDDETLKFRTAVDDRLAKMKEIRATRKRAKMAPPVPAMHQVNISVSAPAVAKETEQLVKKKKNGKRKLSKDVIGEPLDFRHEGHVGVSSTGLEFENLDPDMQLLFKCVGVKAGNHLDPGLVNYVSDFVQKNGGKEWLSREMSTRYPQQAPRPSGSPPAPPPRPSSPPQLPVSTGKQSSPTVNRPRQPPPLPPSLTKRLASDQSDVNITCNKPRKLPPPPVLPKNRKMSATDNSFSMQCDGGQNDHDEVFSESIPIPARPKRPAPLPPVPGTKTKVPPPPPPKKTSSSSSIPHGADDTLSASGNHGNGSTSQGIRPPPPTPPKPPQMKLNVSAAQLNAIDNSCHSTDFPTPPPPLPSITHSEIDSPILALNIQTPTPPPPPPPPAAPIVPPPCQDENNGVEKMDTGDAVNARQNTMRAIVEKNFQLKPVKVKQVERPAVEEEVDDNDWVSIIKKEMEKMFKPVSDDEDDGNVDYFDDEDWM